MALRRYVLDEPRRPAASLLPLRLFTGLGRLRAGVETAVEPGWWDGTRPAAFLTGQLADDRVAFPVYQALMAELFLPHALGRGLPILLGQLLAGAAILGRTLTSLALVAGLFMNLNFGAASRGVGDRPGPHQHRQMNQTDGQRWPAQWAREPYLYLTSVGRRTGRPHPVEIWFAEHEGRLYLLTGGRERAD